MDTGQDTGTLRVAFRRAVLIKVLLVTTAAMLAICSLALVGTTNTAKAEDSLPQNGKIVFDSDRNTLENTNPERDLEIFTMNPDGSDIEQLTDNETDDLMPTYSPDGGRIAFVSTRDRNSEIYTMHADGSNQTRLTNNATGARYPAFFPDGERIVFATDRDGNFEIYVVNTDGSDQTRLTHNSVYDADTSVSSEGKIAFSSYRHGNLDVYIMNADGSDDTRLTRNAAYDTRDAQPTYSPDGKHIAFESTRNGDFEIYVMDTDGSDQTRLTYDQGGLPSFSPDGKEITFVSARDGNEEVYVMDTDGSDLARLTNNPASDRAFDWQPLNPKSRGLTVQPPDTGGPSFILVASVLLFSMGRLLNAVVRRRM